MINGYEIHPVADLFPMMSHEELEELAADIQERGLLDDIVLDQKGHILGGRNRLTACLMVKVEPRFTTYQGDDPAGYALSKNINRRHLSKGQQAMIAVKAESLGDPNSYSNSEYGSIRTIAREHCLKEERISRARTVLQHAPDLADDVVAGIASLDSAYQTARRLKGEAEARRRQAQEARTRAQDIKARHPDLDERVSAGELSWNEAANEAIRRDLVAEREAEQEERNRQDRVRRNSTSFAEHVYYGAKVLPGADIISLFDDSVLGPGYKVTKASIQEATKNLLAVADEWED